MSLLDETSSLMSAIEDGIDMATTATPSTTAAADVRHFVDAPNTVAADVQHFADAPNATATINVRHFADTSDTTTTARRISIIWLCML